MQHIWIFQLAEALDAERENAVLAQLNRLTEDWKAHGAPVPGRAAIRHHRFVIVQAMPGATSGCSIDSMTHGVEGIIASAGVKILPNNIIQYRTVAGDVAQIDFREVSAAVQSGEMGPDTLIFDATMGQTQDLERFEVGMKDSWLKRYLVTA
ncbi:MAG: hypothetical protein AAGN35_26175 [Bacteroidota bacterium]